MDRSPGQCRYFISNCNFTASIQQDVHRFFLRYIFWIAREKAQVVSAWKMYVLGWSKTLSSQIFSLPHKSRVVDVSWSVLENI